MDAKNFIDLLRRYTFARLRFVNFKLWGNQRTGLYREFSADDIIGLIKDFKLLSTPQNSTTSIEDYTTPSPEKELFRAGSNYAILTRLCYQYYIYEGSDRLQQKIIAEVEEIINELRNDADAHAEFEALLNSQHNDIMRRFRTAHPSLKKKDFRLYAYLTAGLSATTIAVLLGKEKSVVYNRISRLKKSINDEFRLP
ncbi:MAG: hypothetical protein IIV58_07510 [Alistipes sp.]|nr:hypothetical protein [Alistipes sp.]